MSNRINFVTVLVAVYCIALTVSNIVASKLWQVAPGFILDTAILLFPIVYIIDDIIPEVFGLKAARSMIWIGFACNALAVLFFGLCLVLPAPDFWQNQSAFEIVLGITPRILLASFIAYLVGTNVNAWVLVRVKQITGGRWLWLRTISSTIAGQSLDSILFVTIAFYGIFPVAELPTIILGQAAFKIVYEIVATPLTYLVINLVKRNVDEIGQFQFSNG